jgi:hypothetical protein
MNALNLSSLKRSLMARSANYAAASFRARAPHLEASGE